MNILRELRKEKNLTIAKTAECLNMPFETYRSYEAGKNQADYETLIKLANFFGVTVDYLLGRDGIVTDEDRANGWIDTTKISIKPVEGKMLEVFREIGERYGKETQEAAIAMLEKML